ncbi:MAG: UDP-N-acetylmuramoyl-tripeptide--D-alanyl-D-alanine ligase [Christensenellales bacterium]|jgi:UDP-N-acetylmuramoyl-tripeptide--D-alanyl-D-alanine ligase
MQILTEIMIGLTALGVAWPMLHIFQLEGYVIRQNISWIKKNTARFFSWEYFALIGAAVLYFVIQLSNAAVWMISAIVLSAALAGAVLISAAKKTLGKDVKKKLAFTKRMQRLIAMTAFVWAVMLVLAMLETVLIPLLAIIAPFLPMIAGWIMQPVERGINQRFFNDAKSRLEKREDLIKIGITGSYGKTSTKFILAAILSQKYNVLASPSSFNTPMGLTRVIREQLTQAHQVFIAEMGARHVGDIDELCDLVAPKYGLITSVGKQHLETFFSLQNIINTKYELIAALPEDGTAFFADDGGIVRGMWERTDIEKVLSGFADDCFITARDISVGERGCDFTLGLGEESIQVSTKLLGRHNISNILLCCAVAIKLGISLQQIKAALAKLEPVEHRLQLIKGAGGLTIIDDAFNSNPAGAKAALEVISQFSGRRVIITPGMVELGDEETELNRKFGRQMAKSVDTAVLLGRKRCAPIRQGLLEEGFPEESIIMAESLNEAMAQIHKYAGAGDVLLFENDLPDNY